MPADDSTVQYRNTPGLDGFRAGDDGTIWTCRVRVRAGVARDAPGLFVLGQTWRQLKTHTYHKRGYQTVTLFKQAGRPVRELVHRLVLLAFRGPPPDGYEGCHEDRNPRNNAITNLRWDTHVNNMADRVRHGTSYHGHRNPAVKLTPEQVVQMREDRRLCPTITYSELGARYRVSAGAARAIIIRKTWTHI